MNAGMHRRAGLVCIVFALLFSVYSGRLIHLQVAKHEEFSQLAADKTGRKKVVPAERGRITDVNGESLAENVPIYAVVVDGKLVCDLQLDRAELAEILSRHLNEPLAEVAERIAPDRAYIVVQRQVPAETVAAVVWFSTVSGIAAATRRPIDCVLAHAGTNLALGAYVLASGAWWLV